MSVNEIMAELSKLGPGEIQLLKIRLAEVENLQKQPETDQPVKVPKARLIRDGKDVFLEAPPGAPAMTAENVRAMKSRNPADI